MLWFLVKAAPSLADLQTIYLSLAVASRNNWNNFMSSD